MTPEELTRTVLQTLQDRKESYGDAILMFESIAQMWSVILGKKVTPRQVALCMVAFKLLRENHAHKDDNIIDMVSYTYFAGNLKGE